MLSTAQQTLLVLLVERHRAATAQPWETFVAVKLGAQSVVIFHPRTEPLEGSTAADIEALGGRGLLKISQKRSGARLLQITPQGFGAVEGGGDPAPALDDR